MIDVKSKKCEREERHQSQPLYQYLMRASYHYVDFTTNDNDVKPIVLAAQAGRVNQLQLLLEAGADPWLK
eukprot:24951-Eustigmatos_ZCMA.PRE.1